MHVALIIDQERLAQEQSMLNRLCIGLMAEGAQVTRIVPDVMPGENVGEGEQRVALAARIEAPMRVLPWMRRTRINQIAETLEKSAPDAFYAIGQGAWALGLELAKGIERPLLIDVCSAEQVKVAPRPRVSPRIAGYIAPCHAIAEMLRRRVDTSLVSMVPMGVSLPPGPRPILGQPDQAASLAILGSGRDMQAYEALLRGLSQVVQQIATMQIFVELRGPHEHAIWQRAEQLGLIGSISAIGEASVYRSLLVGCDLMLIPERLGELRSMMLEAMALGMPVIASRDDALDMLSDGETACFVSRPEPAEWSRQTLALLEDPAKARALGLRARQTVTTHHRSSDQVARLMETLERVQSGGPYRFSPARQ